MVAIARHRGWSSVVVKGATGFRREAWLSGRLQDLEVLGYRPSERDRQLLERRQQARHATAQKTRLPSAVRRDTPIRTQARMRLRMKVVDAVVRARIVEPRERARLLAAARDRLTKLLELLERTSIRADGRSAARGNASGSSSPPEAPFDVAASQPTRVSSGAGG
jgi:hypothetical protein